MDQIIYLRRREAVLYVIEVVMKNSSFDYIVTV